MQERLMRYTAVFTTLFAVAAMAVMFYYSSVKVIVIAGEHTDMGKPAGAELHKAHEMGKKLPLQENATQQYLYISLPDNVTADHISIDNHYMEHMVEIGINGVKPDYYEKENPYGKCDRIEAANYYMEEDTLRMCFDLKDTYEVDYVYETGRLALRFVAPGTLYDRIVLLDTDVDTETGRKNSIAAEVTALVREKLEAEGIKVYDVSTQEGYEADRKQTVINRLNGGLYVAIDIGRSEKGNASGMEAFYNDDFFIPFVGNVTVADSVLREAALSTNAKANGLFLYESTDTALKHNQIPSARLRIGYLESRADMGKLRSEEYRQKLAEGISFGIIKCFEMKEQYDKEKK